MKQILEKRLRSFGHAFCGVSTLFRTQPHARLHLAATVAVVAAGMLFKVSTEEWCWLVLAIMAVLSAEAFNTALEFLADAVHPEKHPLVKNAKDVAAAAVLVSAIGAAVIGFSIFSPHLLK